MEVSVLNKELNEEIYIDILNDNIQERLNEIELDENDIVDETDVEIKLPIRREEKLYLETMVNLVEKYNLKALSILQKQFKEIDKCIEESKKTMGDKMLTEKIFRMIISDLNDIEEVVNIFNELNYDYTIEGEVEEEWLCVQYFDKNQDEYIRTEVELDCIDVYY